MTNKLTKDLNVTVVPGSPGAPGSPGQPYIAPRTVYEDQVVCGWVTTGGSYKWVLNADGVYEYVLVPSGGGTGTVSSSYVCRTMSVPVYYPGQPYVAPTPGVPAIPDQYIYDLDLAWNATARSIKSIGPDGVAMFRIPRPLHTVLVGVRPLYTDPATLLDRQVAYGFRRTGDTVQVVENGAAYTVVLGADPNPVFKIVRRDRKANFYINDLLVHEGGLQESAQEQFYLHAWIFAGGDGVDEPVLIQGSPDFALQPLQASGGTVTGAMGSVSFEALTMTAGSPRGGDLELQALVMHAGAGVGAMGSVQLESLTCSGSDEPMARLTGVTAILPFMLADSQLLVGGLASSDTELPALMALGGTGTYGAADAQMAPMTLDAHAYEGNTNGTLLGITQGTATGAPQLYIAALLVSDVTGDDSLVVVRITDGAVDAAATANGSILANAVLDALMMSQVSVFAGVPVLSDAGEVWAVNEAGAATMYENYSFNSFARIDGKYFGVRADGLYLLEGDTDAGDIVRASVSLGAQDFGTTLAKTVTDCYIGVAASGNVWLKLIANGREYLYRTPKVTPHLDTQRIKPGLGIKANYFTFELYNDTGADFELASVEFQAAALSRRI